MKKTVSVKIAYIASAIALSLLFVHLTGIATSSEWYSPDLNYRLQTDAFLNGKLAIRNDPYEHGYDWVWGNGLQQNWGLGVPFLRLPFEALSHALGGDGFPDRLVFIIYFTLAAFVFLWGIRSVLYTDDPNDWSLSLESLFITLICFISPTLIAMAVTRFDVYEEAVAYNCLWALGLGGLLLRLSDRPKVSLFLVLSFLAGFSPMIRPTGIFYGCITFGLAFFLLYKAKVRFQYILLGFGLFSVCPFLQLYINYLRFGEFFEFGYHRILDMIPVLGFMLKFSFPFAAESVLKASSELFGSLFLVKNLTGLNFFQNSIHSWQAGSLRFREYYFPGFSLIILGTMIIGWVLAFSAKRYDIPIFKLTEKTKRTLIVMSCWSILSFGILFLFYLKKPAFSSRYDIDFLPALVIGTSVFLLVGIIAVKNYLPALLSNILLVVLIIVWLSFNVLNANWIKEQRPNSYRPPAAVNLETMNSLRPKEVEFKPPLPTVYGSEFTKSNYNIPTNLWGWYCYPGQYPQLDSRLVGLVGPSVTLFFGPFECLQLQIKKWRPDIEYDINAIQVKVGTQYLVRDSVDESDGIQTLTFCTPKSGSINKQWNLVTLGFAHTDQVGPKFIAPFKLLMVKALLQKPQAP